MSLQIQVFNLKNKRVTTSKISTYPLDTIESISLRTAIALKTLEKYIYFLTPYDKEEKSINIIDILQEIKNTDLDILEFIRALETSNVDLKKLNIKKDIIEPWLAINKDFKNLEMVNNLKILAVNTLIAGGYFRDETEFNYVWNKRQDIEEGINNKIRAETIRENRYTKLYSIFDNVQTNIDSTDIEVQKISITADINFGDISLLEIFNDIVVNKNAPFACCNQYYKILKNFIPLQDWNNIENDVLIVKINQKIEDINYGEIKIYRDKQQIKLTCDIISEKNYLSMTEFLERFKTIFPDRQISIDNIQETSITAIYYIPQYTINSYVFADIAMNDDRFSSILSIDESVKATKKRSESTDPSTYIYFTHPATGTITASILQKTVDPTFKNIDDKFTLDSNYLRIRLKGVNKISLTTFQEMFEKLLEIYRQQYQNIVDFYRIFVPEFAEMKKPALQRKKSIDRPKDIFIANYSRICSKDRSPIIVNPDRLDEYDQKDIYQFPRNLPKSGDKYPSDGKNILNYTCPNPTYPYFGIQLNKLENKEEYPYLPCCFKTDQKTNPKYQKYYYNIQKTEKDKDQQNLILTDKFLGNGVFGKLSEPITQLFNFLDGDAGYKYIRVGVTRSRSSFLQCVLFALDDSFASLKDSEEIEATLIGVRDNLSDNDSYPLARQSCYDLSKENLVKQIADPDIYLDPKLYLQLLEGKYNCNIFLFNRDTIIKPRYKEGFYCSRQRPNTIFIYEHMGSESDHADYPQCELIVKWNVESSQDVKYSFRKSEKISKNITNLFNTLNTYYVLNKPISPIYLGLKNIKSQSIDSYGKTRRITVDYNSSNINIFTEPINPLNVAEKNGENLENELKTVLDFCIDNEIKITSQSVENNYIKQLNCVIGNVNCYIPIKRGKKSLPDIDIVTTFLPIAKEVSILDRYNFNKKTARYLTEYVFWMFSKFLQKEKILEIDDDVLNKFSKKYFVIDEKFNYPEISKNFETNPKIFSGEKLILQSTETLKRLLYVLKLYSVRHRKTLLQYYQKTSIVDYYLDIADFNKNIEQIILHGNESIDKLVRESKFTHILYEEIRPDFNVPYFFKNNLIDDKVFLAVNVDDYKKGFDITVNWHKNNFVLDYPEPIGMYNFTLFSYSNRYKIKKYYISEGKKGYHIQMIGYKINNTPYYTVLLEL